MSTVYCAFSFCSHLAPVYHFETMLNIDGSIYLAYSGTFAKDAPQTRLLKRAWESLRRNDEFRRDCQLVTTTEPANSPRHQEQLKKKWGVALFEPSKSFDELVDKSATIRLDDDKTFDDLYRRLYGDTFYGDDRVVQCDELLALYHLRGAENFQRLAAIARGQAMLPAPVVTLQDGSSVPQKVQLTIDVDQNLIATLYKVQLVLRALREARVQAGKAKAIPQRIRQQLKTLEEVLDADLIGDGKRDFCHDDDVFRVWDLSEEGMSDSQIARKMWPDEYRRVGGRDTVTSEKGPLIQRVHNYKRRAKQWIQLFSEVVKVDRVIL